MEEDLLTTIISHTLHARAHTYTKLPTHIQAQLPVDHDHLIEEQYQWEMKREFLTVILSDSHKVSTEST